VKMRYYADFSPPFLHSRGALELLLQTVSPNTSVKNLGAASPESLTTFDQLSHHYGLWQIMALVAQWY
jgi:hypothetical protein